MVNILFIITRNFNLGEISTMDIEKGFIKSKDEFGISYCCKQCGKNQFYVEQPAKCDHIPSDYEIKMHEAKVK